MGVRGRHVAMGRCTLTGIALGVPEDLPVEPFDVEIGLQVIELCQPLVARATGGPSRAVRA